MGVIFILFEINHDSCIFINNENLFILKYSEARFFFKYLLQDYVKGSENFPMQVIYQN